VDVDAKCDPTNEGAAQNKHENEYHTALVSVRYNRICVCGCVDGVAVGHEFHFLN